MRPLSRLSVLLLVVNLIAPRARAQSDPGSKWTPSDAHARQEFGSAVAIAGDVAVIGAPGDDPQFSALDYGAAFVYRFDGDAWIEQQKLTKTLLANNDRFGRSVALAATAITDGTSNTLFVGMLNDASLVNPSQGVVYVYQDAGGTFEHAATLTASDGAGGDNFGFDLDVQGIVDGADLLVWQGVVGAPRHSLGSFTQEGAAYLFRSDGGDWMEDQKLTASDAAVTAKFGEAVAISGNRVLIGAPGDRAGGVGQNAGAAYIFEYDGGDWVETAKLTASDAEGQAAFGGKVALDGNRALIGARHDGSSGAAYVFQFDGNDWAETVKLTGSDASGQALFGSAVALDGAQALVGAQGWFPAGGDGTGKVYLFTYDDNLGLWQEAADGLVPGDGGAGDGFGASVALDGGVMLAGAPSHDLPTLANGAVYVYGMPEPPPVGEIGVIAQFTDRRPAFNRTRGVAVAAGDINGDGHADIAAMQGCVLTVFDAVTLQELWQFDVQESMDGNDWIVCEDDEVPPDVDIALVGFVDFHQETNAIIAVELDGGRRIIAILIGVKGNDVAYAEEAHVVAILKLPGGKSAVALHEPLNGGGILNVIGEVPTGPLPPAQSPSTPAPKFRASSGAYPLDVKFQSEPDVRLGYDPDLYDPPGDTDLDGDGVLDIPMLTVQDEQVDGIIVRSGATLDILWEYTFPAVHRENLLKGVHGFADVDGDGEKEVIMGENLAVTLDGVVHTIAANFVTLDVNDVDGDGFEDIIGLNLPDDSIVIYGIGLVTPAVEAAGPAALPGFLFQSYPNPFHDHTTIAFEIVQPGPVVIGVYDVLGRRVYTLVDDIRSAGRHEITWNGRDGGGLPLANGTYFYRLEADGFRTTRQALYIR